MKSSLRLLFLALLFISCGADNENNEEFVFLSPNRSFSENKCQDLATNDDLYEGINHYYVNEHGESIQLDYDVSRRYIVSESWHFDDLDSTDTSSIEQFIDKKNTTRTTVQLIGYDSKFNFQSGDRHQFVLKDKSGWNLFECFLSITDDKNQYELNVTYNYLNEF